MTKKATFATLPLVAFATFAHDSTSQGAKERFIRDWKIDPAMEVKSFKRMVRAGGAAIEVTAVVVRRKAA